MIVFTPSSTMANSASGFLSLLAYSVWVAASNHTTPAPLPAVGGVADSVKALSLPPLIASIAERSILSTPETKSVM